jgi:uncharacterized protein (DUF1330 family)
VVIQVVVLLRAGDPGLVGLREFERKVLPVLREHGGRLVYAFEPEKTAPDAPDEIHILEFPSREHLEAYRGDPRLAKLAALRESAISATTVYVAERSVDYGQ